jgi:hypothetical protein
MLSDKCQIHFTWIRSIFPKIKAWTQLSVCDSRLPDVLSIHEIIVERPVALMTLIAVVLGTPNPQGPPAGTALSPFGGVDVIHLRNSAYIYGGEESNDSTIDLLVSWPPICDIAGVFFSGECHTTWSHGCHPTTSQRQAARDVATWLALLVPGARMLELQAEGPSTFPPIDAPPAAEQPRDLWENTSPPSNRRSPKRLDVYLSKGHIDHLQQDVSWLYCSFSMKLILYLPVTFNTAKTPGSLAMPFIHHLQLRHHWPGHVRSAAAISRLSPRVGR